MNNGHELWDSYNDDPYGRLEIIARDIVRRNPEATFYDLFNTIREDIFGDYVYQDNTVFIQDIDFEVEYDAKRDKLNGYR